jgi:hypothetical protein
MKPKQLTFLLALTFLFLFSGNSFAQSFSYRCQDDHKFQKNYIIDLQKKTVVHKSSFNYANEKKFDVDRTVKVIAWEYDELQLIWFLQKSSKPLGGRGYYYNLYAIDFKNNTLLQTGILPGNYTKENKVSNYISKCYKD